jgi:internalin A
MASGASIDGVPSALLGTGHNVNCLPRVRAHLDDLGEAPSRFNDVKLAILGNGRIGKTQIANRLRGESFEADADSTHGISLRSSPIPGSDGVFNIWDFGGQDIYHGLHALFLQGRAVYVLAWTPERDDGEDIDEQGMVFRNRPLVWWLDFIKRADRTHSPLVIVQNQSDRFGDRGEHPALGKVRDNFRWCKSLSYSAQTNDGRAILDASLHEAAARFNVPLIGMTRLAVIERLRSMREDDAIRPPDMRRHRLLSFAGFEALCAEAGGVSDARLFLEFLHNAGHVFWRHGVFNDQIVLDQAWMLDGVYTVMNRDRCISRLKASHGRFTRADLGELIWNEEGRSVTEQELFLEFMIQAGVVFVYSQGSHQRETIYAAPDLFPADWSASARDERWGDGEPDAERTFTFSILPDVLMRNVISYVGGRSGLKGHYWRRGFYGYDSQRRAKALVEAELDENGGGRILLKSRGGQSASLIDGIAEILIKEAARLGLFFQDSNSARDSASDKISDTPKAFDDIVLDHEPLPGKSYFVSYAWGGL